MKILSTLALFFVVAFSPATYAIVVELDYIAQSDYCFPEPDCGEFDSQIRELGSYTLNTEIASLIGSHTSAQLVIDNSLPGEELVTEINFVRRLEMLGTFSDGRLTLSSAYAYNESCIVLQGDIPCVDVGEEFAEFFEFTPEDGVFYDFVQYGEGDWGWAVLAPDEEGVSGFSCMFSGVVSSECVPTTPEVPLPAAAWLFLSALIGLIAKKRY